MDDYRYNEPILSEARLMSSPPHVVYDWLERRASTVTYDRTGDEKLEMALLARGDPLIDLGLARFGHHLRAVASLFARTDQMSGHRHLRLAVLSNAIVGRGRLFFPKDLAGAGTGYSWLDGLTRNEVAALFANSGLPKDFFEDFMSGRGGWDRLDTEHQRAAIGSYVASLIERTGGRASWGLRLDQCERAPSASWELAERVPVTDAWAQLLSIFFEGIHTYGYGLDDPLSIAQRWYRDFVDPHVEHDRKQGYRTLDDFQRVRKELARLAAEKSKDEARRLLEHKDVPIRLGALQVARMSADEVRAAAKDLKSLAVRSMLRNYDGIWRDPDTREALREATDRLGGSDAADLDREFRDVEARLRAHRSYWFDEAREPQSPADQRVREDIAQLRKRLELLTNLLVFVAVAVVGLAVAGAWS